MLDASVAAASGAREPSDEPHADADDARRLVNYVTSTLLARVAFERKFDCACKPRTEPAAERPADEVDII